MGGQTRAGVFLHFRVWMWVRLEIPGQARGSAGGTQCSLTRRGAERFDLSHSHPELSGKCGLKLGPAHPPPLLPTLILGKHSGSAELGLWGTLSCAWSFPTKLFQAGSCVYTGATLRIIGQLCPEKSFQLEIPLPDVSRLGPFLR